MNQDDSLKLMKVSIFGVRGIVGQTLTPKRIINFASAFGSFLGSGTVLVGRDTRASGLMLSSAVTSALISAGLDVVDLGICPTPVLQYMIGQKKAAGGISISAAHNAINWNALILLNNTGAYLNVHQGEEVLDIYHAGDFQKQRWDGLGRLDRDDGCIGEYMDRLASFLDVEKIASKNFRVIIDPCNGAGAGIIDLFCKRMGVELIPINNEPTGMFLHDPEPRPRNAGQIASIMGPVKGDIGFLLNSDVSRVSIVSDVGETVTEEYTFPLVAEHILSRTPGPIVSNFSTTRTVDDIAGKYGCRLIKSHIGQSFNLEAIINEGAVIGGEGSGSVALPEFQLAFDGFLTMGLILEMMARQSTTSSELVGSLPRYHIVKEKIYCPPNKVYSIVDEMKRFYQDSPKVDFTDGVRVDWKDGWLHIRPSDTEPLIRVICECGEKSKARATADAAINKIQGLI
jgi:phosphoglucosamine mutase